MNQPKCRFCSAPLAITFADLGLSPLANAFICAEEADQPETFFPLHALVCERCLLVQVRDVAARERIFGDYAYFSSYSQSWLAHCSRYASDITRRLGLGSDSKVVEVASNDGYMLRFFRERGIPVLGVEPAGNVARVAIAAGVDTRMAFFGRETARRLLAEGHAADLMIANNVLAHAPDLNDFVAGFEILLKPEGVLTLEFPHLARMIEQGQFDTIYHEHFSYFSFLVAESVLAAHGLRVFDVEEVPTHGGSLRVHACRTARGSHRECASVALLRARERALGLDRLDVYRSFAERVVAAKCDLLEFLLRASRDGRRVVGYGAPAKGNTLLNYCGVGPELIAFTVDRSPHKQGRLLPGTRIPIRAPAAILAEKPDYVLILPWNLKDEICSDMQAVRGWGGRFVVPVPQVEVLP